ncbi:putative two-component response regulator [Azospirillum lipoferum 4B]|uniref:Two-component response regulator n=1 Tax=Azospirillum lipoferum (strain 4B) TaxID=862719 RepID=G7Z914_AZOL4|nr:putative two-component response regulator [Azospirillum lipoferum 4B]
MHILLAEDETVTRLAARTLLERAGHRVVAVEDGPAAVAAAAQIAFDVILMDLGLPGLPGDEAVRAIRGRPAGSSPRILMLTASITADGRDRCAGCGADGILAKPLQLDSLAAALAGSPQAAAPVDEPDFDESAIATMRDMLPAARAAELIAKTAAVLRHHDRTLGEALRNGDRTTAGAMAHKIAGVSGQYGCLALRRAARALEAALESAVEAALEDGSAADLPRRIAELTDALAPALAFLDRCAAAARG